MGILILVWPFTLTLLSSMRFMLPSLNIQNFKNFLFFFENNDKHILWSHIYKLYDDDQRRLLRMSKLRDAHVRLTPSSRMSVLLAAQVRVVNQVILGRYLKRGASVCKFLYQRSLHDSGYDYFKF